ncbi:MAG: FHA domain-containing protein [Acidobacteriota bacterium]
MSKHGAQPGSDLTITAAEPPDGEAVPLRRQVRIRLNLVRGSGSGQTYDLSRGGDFTIGREGCDINLDDHAVSRRHARLLVKAWDHIYLHDLNSKNGSFVNGVRQTRRKLAHNDLIRLGGVSLRLSIEEACASGG